MPILEVTVSGDAIIGLCGVVLGVILTFVIDVVRKKMGKVTVVATHSIIDNTEWSNKGYLINAKVTVNIIVTSSKNISVSLYDWRLYIGEKSYKFELVDDENDMNRKFLGVMNIAPNEVRKTILTGNLLFELYEKMYDTYDNVAKPEYKGVGKINDIEKIKIGYRCGCDKKENIITPDKFIFEKKRK